jgi:hypothetical protein
MRWRPELGRRPASPAGDRGRSGVRQRLYAGVGRFAGPAVGDDPRPVWVPKEMSDWGNVEAERPALSLA